MTGPGPAAVVWCEVCGRRLRTEQSRRRGRGLVCDEKVNPSGGRDHSPQRLRITPAGGSRRAAVAGPAEPTLLDELDQDS